ncbi:hypothetical protein SY83_21230 [Paenibacillus swuensis]|uniref:Tyr recombinase domain-containing protein n=1 Tax=Paenibacillus swuensis TaxID=1178515 RepID=A0A172TNR0_9BACL|nr:hypothetical protein [Paenibacillus swuensis]ANE48383.1 hypothetical protein SY83_21230 [Paenibacillus swuensis]
MNPDKLLHIEAACLNPQDAILFRLYLEGVEIHEMIYLKSISLDPVNRILKISNASGRTRELTVSAKCVALYQKALHQAYYISETRTEMIPLMKSAFLLKASIYDYKALEGNLEDMDAVILRTIDRRLHDLSQIHSYPELTYLPSGLQMLQQTV